MRVGFIKQFERKIPSQIPTQGFCQATDARKHMPRSHTKLSTQAPTHETRRRYEKYLTEERYGVNAWWAFLRNCLPSPASRGFQEEERGGDGGEGSKGV